MTKTISHSEALASTINDRIGYKLLLIEEISHRVIAGEPTVDAAADMGVITTHINALRELKGEQPNWARPVTSKGATWDEDARFHVADSANALAAWRADAGAADAELQRLQALPDVSA